jgi:lysozyme family protein
VQGKHYADIREDGDVGPATLRALDAYLKRRGKEGEAVMVKALNALQGARYLDLARRRAKNEDFVYGWLRTRL